jgi:hypothetical protein
MDLSDDEEVNVAVNVFDIYVRVYMYKCIYLLHIDIHHTYIIIYIYTWYNSNFWYLRWKNGLRAEENHTYHYHHYY